jgi:class 3 adenylate cyclase
MNTPFAPNASESGDPVTQIRALLGVSHNLAAVERARAAWADAPRSGELAYLFALGCLRSGALDSAQDTIGQLRDGLATSLALQADVESLAGRLAKERFVTAKSNTDRAQALNVGIAAYLRADALQPNLHARINAATLLRLAGALAESETLARSILVELQSDGRRASHWDCATRAEAWLLTGETALATQGYGEAGRLAGLRFGDIASMRRQLQLISSVVDAAQAALEAVPGPKVIAFSGHMIDTEDRSCPRFPPGLEDAVLAAIDRSVLASIPIIAYTQAACGSDILFCESLLNRSQEVNIVLPFARDDYIAQSVRPGGASWVARFERVMDSATSITYATEERYLGDDVLFEHASNLIQGMAFLRARELAVTPGMLVVADSSQAGSLGGTLATQAAWAMQAKPVEVIDLAQLRTSIGNTAAALEPMDALPARVRAPAQRVVGGGRTIKSLLFADVKGFSRLAEEFFPAFFNTFLGLVPKILQDIGVQPPEISSRGDGLYAVFDTPEQAAHFALTLSAAVGALDWVAMGLPSDTHLRIALHAGPVFSAIDPVTGNFAHYGSHVTRAARVEPIVIPGQVLVTEPFAAVLAARPETAYACDLVGTERLAKDYGDARLYRLRRK